MIILLSLENKTTPFPTIPIPKDLPVTLETQIRRSPLLDGKFFEFKSHTRIITRAGKYTEQIRARRTRCVVEISGVILKI